MKFPRRHFIKLTAGACVVPSLSLRRVLAQAAPNPAGVPEPSASERAAMARLAHAFMQKYEVAALSFAVGYAGEIVHQDAFRFADRESGAHPQRILLGRVRQHQPRQFADRRRPRPAQLEYGRRGEKLDLPSGRQVPTMSQFFHMVPSMKHDAGFGVLTGNGIETLSFKAGDIIFREGDNALDLFVIKSGQVRIQIGNRTITELSPDTIFGEMALIDDEPRSATAIAVTDVELVPVSEKQFLFLVSQTPYLRCG